MSGPELRLILTRTSDPESRGSDVRSRMKPLILDRTSDPEWSKRGRPIQNEFYIGRPIQNEFYIGRPIQNEAQNILIKLILVENQSQKIGDKFPNIGINA